MARGRPKKVEVEETKIVSEKNSKTTVEKEKTTCEKCKFLLRDGECCFKQKISLKKDMLNCPFIILRREKNI